MCVGIEYARNMAKLAKTLQQTLIEDVSTEILLHVILSSIIADDVKKQALEIAPVNCDLFILKSCAC